ncbi:MAG: serine/threonine protein kinase [Chloroflexi bacterium]|nr:serine/threonine protein kinase [Chloroflexota bacterium]
MSPSNLEGITLGKYRILEPLGRGGMAQVYKAYHPQLDRYMAVKILRSDLVESEEFLARFRHEAHAVSGLRHANIVQVFDFDMQDDYYYMVMELLEGDTLRSLLNNYRVRKQRMPLAEIVRITKDVLSGLSYAHGEGIIHRDIKPANIMLTKKGQAVLTDFGIAQIVGSTQHTVSGALMGTLNYMAPEQGLKGECDTRSDIYSLGIVLYEMLTGYTPFDADTPLAILMKHLNDPLPLPTQVDPTLPLALEMIVLKALAKDPDDRFQSADEMRKALENVEQNLSTDTRPNVPPPGGFSQQAVFSGTSRKQITDHRFADADTDAGIKPLTNKPAPRFDPEVDSPLEGLFTTLTVSLSKIPVFRISPVTAVFGGIALYIFVNFVVVMVDALSSQDVMARAWPVEIFLFASFLALIGWGTQKWGVMIPSGIVFGTGIILTYCSLTGRWGDWAFLWVAELFFIWLSIFLPVRIGQIPNAGPVWARVFGVAVPVVSLFLISIIIFLSFVIASVSPLFSQTGGLL